MRCLSVDLLRHSRLEEPEPPHPKGFLVRVFDWLPLCGYFGLTTQALHWDRGRLARLKQRVHSRLG